MIQTHVPVEPHALTTCTIIPAIARMVIKASTAIPMLTGVLLNRVKMVASAGRKKILSTVLAHLDGLENCVTSKWFLVQMLPYGKELKEKICVTTEHVKTLETAIDAIVRKAILVHTVQQILMNVSQPPARTELHART